MGWVAAKNRGLVAKDAIAGRVAEMNLVTHWWHGGVSVQNWQRWVSAENLLPLAVHVGQQQSKFRMCYKRRNSWIRVEVGLCVCCKFGWTIYIYIYIHQKRNKAQRHQLPCFHQRRNKAQQASGTNFLASIEVKLLSRKVASVVPLSHHWILKFFFLLHS